MFAVRGLTRVEIIGSGGETLHDGVDLGRSNGLWGS